MSRRALSLFGPLCLLLAAGCGGAELAPKIIGAMRPTSLPAVVACWETELEQAGFTGSYVATVDLTIEAETSRIKAAKVTRLVREEGVGDASPSEGTFRSCVERALLASKLATEATEGGTGFREDGDIAVEGLRMAFVDASSERRRDAARRVPHVLLGPRADRCQGLYSHDPPRDASVLDGAIAEAERRAKAIGATDLDAYARELQKEYDAALELIARLRDEATDPLVPAANHARVETALVEAEAVAQRTGKLIGCTVPTR